MRSPALAGIDPSFGSSSSLPEPFPRARGDRPLMSVHRATPARSPALAGIDPAVRMQTRSVPQRSPALAGIDPVADRGPGSIRRSPALAGIDPRSRSSRRMYSRSPALAGIDPAAVRRAHQRRSPALAGIDPPVDIAGFAPKSFPRARGDRPWRTRSRPSQSFVPPRSRG